MTIVSGKLYLILAVGFLLTACTSIPGIPGFISESTSEFDGAKQIKMEPAWLYNSPIKLALFKNTTMPVDDVVLTVVIKGAHTFSEGESLHFNIDGDIVSFNALDLLTNYNTSSGFVGSGIYLPPSNWSFKDYLVTKNFVQRLVDAERVVVKVDLRKSFVEGVFSSDGPTTARPAFREFNERIATLILDK